MPSAEFKKKGTFTDVVLPALLVQAVNTRFTGMFRAERESIIKVIYFKEGEIAFASSNQPSDRLGEVLIKRGQLTREQLDMAMSKLEANVSLGRMLVELGYLSPKELLAGAKTQVEEILFSLNSWKEGSYEFVEGPLPPRIVDLKLNTRQVIFQCILQVEDRNWVLEQVGSMETVLAPEADLAEALQQMRLEPEAQQVIGNINGTNTVRDLAARSRLDEFTVTKIAAALNLLNLARITVHEAAEHGGEFLARFGEEEERTTDDQTVVGRVPGSETLPGYEPRFEEEPVEERTEMRGGADTWSMPPPGEDEASERTTPTLAAEEEEGGPAPGEEMAYEEEEAEAVEEGETPRRRWLLPVLAVVFLAAAAAVGYFVLWPKPAPETATATPAPTRRPVASPTPTRTAPVVLPPGTPPPAFTPLPTFTPAPMASPALSPMATIPALTPTPMPTRTGAATPTPAATPSPLPTRIAAPTPTPGAALTRTPAPPIGVSTPTPTHAAAVTPPPTFRTPVPPVRPPAPGRTPPPAPGAAGFADPGAAGAARGKLESGQYREAAQGFRQAVAGSRGYALQLEIVCQESSVKEGMGNAAGSGEYFILPFSLRGRPCYRVLWGVYPSQAAAARASQGVPAFFRSQMRGRPFPVVAVAAVR